MIEKKTIGISALISLGIVLAGIFVPGFFDSPKYYCDAKPELGVLDCDRLSSTEKTCYPQEGTRVGSKYCSVGWLSVIDDFVPDDEGVKPIEIIKPIPQPNIISGEGQYICRPPPEYDCVLK